MSPVRSTLQSPRREDGSLDLDETGEPGLWTDSWFFPITHLIFLFSSAATVFVPRRPLGIKVSQSPGALAMGLTPPPFPTHTPRYLSLSQSTLSQAGWESISSKGPIDCELSSRLGVGLGPGGTFKLLTIDICSLLVCPPLFCFHPHHCSIHQQPRP